jgi:hypothetical protein
MHLFLHHILRYLLKSGLEEDAVIFARSYEKFVYFGHALEILLHTVLEEEAGHDLGNGNKTSRTLFIHDISICV